MNPDPPLGPSKAPGFSRRAFCATVYATVCGTATAAALRAGPQAPATAERPPDPHPVKLTDATRAQLKPGMVLDYRRLGAFYLAADERGVFALTAICTHRGCLVLSEGPTGFGCPCHDSAYNLQGEVTEGPAKLPLRHLAVQESEPGGRLQVDISTAVPPETRL